jgi:hypothetical protein
MPGYFRLGHVSTGKVRLGKVRKFLDRVGMVMPCEGV